MPAGSYDGAASVRPLINDGVVRFDQPVGKKLTEVRHDGVDLLRGFNKLDPYRHMFVGMRAMLRFMNPVVATEAGIGPDQAGARDTACKQELKEFVV